MAYYKQSMDLSYWHSFLLCAYALASTWYAYFLVPVQFTYPYKSIEFFNTLFAVQHVIPIGLTLIYGIGNISLNLLNLYWCVTLLDPFHIKLNHLVSGLTR